MRSMLDWFMYLGCLLFGHYFNFRVSTPDGKGGWKDYYSCGMCGRRKPISNKKEE